MNDQNQTKSKEPDIVSRLLEPYLNPGGKELDSFLKFANVMAGIWTFHMLNVIKSGISDPTRQLFQFLTSGDPMLIIAFIVSQAIPFLFAIIVASSLKKGRPLRFFLTGFFLYGGMWTLAGR